MIRELGARERLALLGAAVVVVNPIFWFDSVVWGQADSVGVVFLLLGLRALWRDQPERAAIFAVIAALVKPQLGILIPLVAVVTIRRALWPPTWPGRSRRGARPSRGDGVIDRLRAWERRTDRPIQDPHDGHRRLADDGRAVHPVRPVGAAAGRGGAVPQVRPHRADRQGRRRLPIPDGQRVQCVGRRAGRPRQQPREQRPVGLRRRRGRVPRNAARVSPCSGSSRPSWSERGCWSRRSSSCSGSRPATPIA